METDNKGIVMARKTTHTAENFLDDLHQLYKKYKRLNDFKKSETVGVWIRDTLMLHYVLNGYSARS